jgi:uncharacterized protein (UPF0335 family)
MTAETDHYGTAVKLVREHDKASTSWLQRQIGVGYNTAAKLIERMEADGIVSAPDHVGRRFVLGDDGQAINPPAPVEQQMTIPVDLPKENRAADDRLRLLIERVERLEEEKKGISDDVRDIFNEAKAVGYDVKIMRQIVRIRKMKPDDRREQDMLLDTYKCSLGID